MEDIGRLLSYLCHNDTCRYTDSGVSCVLLIEPSPSHQLGVHQSRGRCPFDPTGCVGLAGQGLLSETAKNHSEALFYMQKTN